MYQLGKKLQTYLGNLPLSLTGITNISFYQIPLPSVFKNTSGNVFFESLSKKNYLNEPSQMDDFLTNYLHSYFTENKQTQEFLPKDLENLESVVAFQNNKAFLYTELIELLYYFSTGQSPINKFWRRIVLHNKYISKDLAEEHQQMITVIGVPILLDDSYNMIRHIVKLSPNFSFADIEFDYNHFDKILNVTFFEKTNLTKGEEYYTETVYSRLVSDKTNSFMVLK